MNTRLAPFLVVPAFAALSLACVGEKAPQQAAQPAPETVFVQQPVAPPPAPAPLEVSPRAIAFDALGDTVHLALPEGATCVAASGDIATVDEQGLVKAVGNGVTHLRCWEGEHNASIRVTVTQQLARVAVVADEGLAMRRSGDSLHLGLARVDRLGTPVTDARPTWISLSPGVVRVDSTTGVAIGVADTGTARVVGSADRFADTVIVEVGVKAASTTLLSSSGRTSLSRSRTLARANAQRNGRPSLSAGPGGIATQAVTTDAATQQQQQQQQGPGGIGVRQAQNGDSLFRDPQTGDFTNARTLAPTLMAGFAEYRILTTAGGLEKTSGPVYGGELSIMTRGVLSFRFNFLTGTLGKDTSTVTKDRKLASGSFDAGVTIAPWLTLVAGAEARRFEDVTVQRWIMVRAGAEANFSLGGGPLRGIARLQVVPLISIASDVPTSAPSFGLLSALGIGFENRRISSSLLYDIERFSFPANTGRKEQFGALMFRFGYKFGW